MYTKNNRERVKNADGSNSFLLEPVTYTKQLEVKKKSSAEKEIKIVSEVLDRDDQLNLMARIIEQIGDLIGLDTPEFQYAKIKFAQIEEVLSN